MNKNIRYLFVALLLLCTLLLTACVGEEATAPETTEETPPETTSPCAHPNLKEMYKEPTCIEDGYSRKNCEDCSYQSMTVLASAHFYESEYDMETGREISTCLVCGVRGHLLGAGKCLELSGYLDGEAEFTLFAEGGESEVELWVDDDLFDVATCGKEEVGLRTESLERAVHFFTFNNVGEADVLITTECMEGKLNRRDAVLLEVLPVKSDTYNSVNVYVQTSDPSGDYYVRYRLVYEYNDARDVVSFCSTTNISNYRIRTSELVKVERYGAVSVEATEVCQVLEGGEISLAVTQRNVDRSILNRPALQALGNSTQSGDCVGGYHGDERLRSAALYADGEQVEIFGERVGSVYVCTYAAFDQTTTAYAWGTSTEDSFGKEMLLHTQNFVFDSSGIHNHKTAEWLNDGFEIGIFYFQMFTLRRSLGNGQAVCEQIEAFDENGNSLGSATVPLKLAADRNYLSNLKNRKICYSSATSGVSAEASFEIFGDSVKVDRMFVMGRSAQGDNKLYVSFCSAKNGNYPRKGEVYEIEAFYHIDYIAPDGK